LLVPETLIQSDLCDCDEKNACEIAGSVMQKGEEAHTMKIVAGLLGILASFSAHAMPGQSAKAAQPRPPLLAQPRDEVVYALGEPNAVFAVRTAQTYDPDDRRKARAASPILQDIYNENIDGTEFEIRVTYNSSDEVKQILFKPEKSLSLQRTLALLPWVSNFCESGCKLLETASNTAYFAYIYPTKVTPTQLQIAATMVDSGTAAPPHPQPCIQATFQDKVPANFHGPLPAFDSLTTSKVSIGVCDPAFEKQSSSAPSKESDPPPLR
jgi:hypothetical protein